MRANKISYRLYAPYIEAIHDTGISFCWPGAEPVSPLTCKDLNLLYSAASAPYQDCFGVEVYPSISAKAAYLFFHVVTSHIFDNGNKRTGIICLDQFLWVNGYYLHLDNSELQRIAEEIADYRTSSRQFHEVLHALTKLISENVLPFSTFRRSEPAFYRALNRVKWMIRRSATNSPGAITLQELRYGTR